MPTENRSSNTEMVSVPFRREDRYIVIKRSDLKKVPVNYRSALVEPMFSLLSHLPHRECLVVESDWPEFEPTWAAIEARVTGKPAQHQGEPVAAQIRFRAMRKGLPGFGSDFGPWREMFLSSFNPGRLTYIESAGYEIETRALYTHADPGEVERLRNRMLACEEIAENNAKAFAEALKKLAELDALLRDFCAHSALICGDLLRLAREDDCATTDPVRARAHAAMDHSRKVKKALSASAKPSAMAARIKSAVCPKCSSHPCACEELIAPVEIDDPCKWSDRQVLDFLGVALRNVDLQGEVRLSEIRQGFEYMRDRAALERKP